MTEDSYSDTIHRLYDAEQITINIECILFDPTCSLELTVSTTSRIICTALFASVLASPAFAGGDIVKCVDADGRVTITDSQCGNGEGKLLVSGSDIPVAKPVKAGLQRVALTPEPVQHDNWIDPRPHSKMLARDAATLKAARTSLQVMDEMRGQRVAVN